MAENKRDGQVRQYVRVSETAADDVVGSSEEAQRAGKRLRPWDELGGGWWDLGILADMIPKKACLSQMPRPRFECWPAPFKDERGISD